MRWPSTQPGEFHWEVKGIDIGDLVVHITEFHMDYGGGYPFDCEEIGGKLVVAETDPGKDNHRTLLATYPFDSLVKWEIAAKKLFKKWSNEAAAEGVDIDLCGLLTDAYIEAM